MNGYLMIGDGTHTGATASGNPTINVYGNLTVSTAAVYTKGTGTTDFKKNGTQSWADYTTGQDLGIVSINGANAAVNVVSSAAATTLTINASQALSMIGPNNTLTLSSATNNGTLTGGSGIIQLSGAGTPLTNGGTFNYNTSTVRYIGNGATMLTLSGAAGGNRYYNLELKPERSHPAGDRDRCGTNHSGQ